MTGVWVDWWAWRKFMLGFSVGALLAIPFGSHVTEVTALLWPCAVALVGLLVCVADGKGDRA